MEEAMIIHQVDGNWWEVLIMAAVEGKPVCAFVCRYLSCATTGRPAASSSNTTAYFPSLAPALLHQRSAALLRLARLTNFSPCACVSMSA